MIDDLHDLITVFKVCTMLLYIYFLAAVFMLVFLARSMDKIHAYF